jgi:hypothetical protein
VADGHYSYHEQAVTAMAHACVGEHVFFLENTDFEMFLLSLFFAFLFTLCMSDSPSNGDLLLGSNILLHAKGVYFYFIEAGIRKTSSESFRELLPEVVGSGKRFVRGAVVIWFFFAR